MLVKHNPDVEFPLRCSVRPDLFLSFFIAYSIGDNISNQTYPDRNTTPICRATH